MEHRGGYLGDPIVEIRFARQVGLIGADTLMTIQPARDDSSLLEHVGVVVAHQSICVIGAAQILDADERVALGVAARCAADARTAARAPRAAKLPPSSRTAQ